MAHFFKYSHRPLHAGTKELESRNKREEFLRKEGVKKIDSHGLEQVRRANIKLSSDVKERRLKDLAQARMFREMAKKKKGSAISKALNKAK